MEFILDFQGFKNENNGFIIKELAIISVDETINDLHLFQPPYSFHHLPDHLKIQVQWLEKHFHGLLWNSGHKNFNELGGVLKDNFKFGGTVYVKGLEKSNYIQSLTADIGVSVLNIEDFGCPSLPVLRRTQILTNHKTCPFNHPPDHCALCNAKLILEWWKMERLMLSRVEIVNLAIKECFSKGYKKMSNDLIKHLPKYFILNYHEDVDDIFDKLPHQLKVDEDVIGCKRCDRHYHCFESADSDCWDGKNPKIKDCFFCTVMRNLNNSTDN